MTGLIFFFIFASRPANHLRGGIKNQRVKKGKKILMTVFSDCSFGILQGKGNIYIYKSHIRVMNPISNLGKLDSCFLFIFFSTGSSPQAGGSEGMLVLDWPSGRPGRRGVLGYDFWPAGSNFYFFAIIALRWKKPGHRNGTRKWVVYLLVNKKCHCFLDIFFCPRYWNLACFCFAAKRCFLGF